MPTITLRTKTGAEIATVKSHLLVAHAGSVTHTLHLHKSVHGHWTVSDPRTGGAVLHVNGQYMGITTSSAGYTLKEIKALAHSQIESLIERIGSDKFNQVLATA